MIPLKTDEAKVASPTYVIELSTGEVSEFVGDALRDLRERHYLDSFNQSLAPASITTDQVRQSPCPDVVLRLDGGLPSPSEIAYSREILMRNGRVYYYWPRESAIECVTRERLASFRRHVRFVALYARWRAFKERRAANARPVAPPPSDPATLGEPSHSNSGRERIAGDAARQFITSESGEYRVAGRGLYVRLDYWAKLTGGGSYGHTCYQAKALHKVCRDGLICVTASPFALLNEFNIPQIVVPSRSPMADEFTLVENGAAYEPVIEALIKLYQPKFVFERLVLGNCAVSRACRRLGVPHFAEFNGSELTMSRVFGGREMNNAEVLQSIETESFREADLICTVSDPVKDMVTGLGITEEKILVNPNGVDLDAYGPLPSAERESLRTSLGFAPDDVIVGFCGTFGGWHGIEVLAEAMPQICRGSEKVKFLLIGDGNFKHLVTDAISRHHLAAKVKDVGMVPQQEAARLLAVCDVLLSPHSKNMGDKPFFGSPTKLFEYMAYGAGIVCSDLVQLGEVMRPALTLADRRSGGDVGVARSVLVAPASVSELVAATLWLVDDELLRKALGRNAQAAAAAYYSWDIHVQSLLRFACGEAPIGYHEDRRVL